MKNCRQITQIIFLFFLIVACKKENKKIETPNEPSITVTPPAATINTWRALSSGNGHSIGIKTDGTLWAWGVNTYGQLGDGTNTNSNRAVQIGLDTNWKLVCCGNFFSMAIKSNGTLWAWGFNYYGELGDGTKENKNYPIQIGTETNWKTLSCGPLHVLAIKTNGSLWAWGSNILGGPVKNNPLQIGIGSSWTDVATSNAISLAINEDGTLWGIYETWNVSGYFMSKVDSDATWHKLAAGDKHVLAIKTNGTLWTWGDNNYGQLGDGTLNSRNTKLTQVGFDRNWAMVSGGLRHSLALKTDGTLWAFGSNYNGQLGDPSLGTMNTPTPIGQSTDWLMIVAAGFNGYGIKKDGRIWGWGMNSSGELGDSTYIDKVVPTLVH